MPRALAAVTSLPAPRERATRQKPDVERPQKTVRKGRKATLHSQHEVSRLETQASALLTAIQARLPEGRSIGMQSIDDSARSKALAALLVNLGVLAEVDVQAEQLRYTCDILAGVLQGMEEQALRMAQAQQAASQGPQIEAVRMPSLVVARR